MATDTTLKMVSGTSQYATVGLQDAQGNLVGSYDITLVQLQAVQAAAAQGQMPPDLPPGGLWLAREKPLLHGQCYVESNGDLIISTGKALNKAGVMDDLVVMLLPEEFTFDGITVSIPDAVAKAIPSIPVVAINPVNT